MYSCSHFKSTSTVLVDLINRDDSIGVASLVPTDFVVHTQIYRGSPPAGLETDEFFTRFAESSSLHALCIHPRLTDFLRLTAEVEGFERKIN